MPSKSKSKFKKNSNKKKHESDDEEISENELEEKPKKSKKKLKKTKEREDEIDEEEPKKSKKKTTEPETNIEPLFSKPHFVCFLGRPRQGKSHCMRWLLSKALAKNVFKFGIVFTNTKMNGDYDFIDDKYVIQGYDENVLQAYLDFVEETTKDDEEEKEEEKKKSKKKKRPPENFIVFDDLAGVMKDSAVWKSFISRYRHYNCSVLFGVQYATFLSTLARECITHACLFSQKTKRARKHIYETVGDTMDEKPFNLLLDEMTSEPHHFMWYDANADDDAKFASRVAPPPEKLSKKVFTFDIEEKTK
jgi:hypothetical protein